MSRLRACLYFAWILVPMAVIFGLMVYTMAVNQTAPGAWPWGDGEPLLLLAVPIAGFLFFPTFGFLLTTSVLPPLRSRPFTRRERLFPTACAVLFCVLTLSGLVENSTDGVGRRMGHAYDNWLISTSAILWAITATVVVAGIDRLLARRGRPQAVV